MLVVHDSEWLWYDFLAVLKGYCPAPSQSYHVRVCCVQLLRGEGPVLREEAEAVLLVDGVGKPLSRQIALHAVKDFNNL